MTAPLMMALSGDDKTSPAELILGVLRKVVLHPFIIATAAGVAAAYFELHPPLAIERLLEYLSSAAAPCSPSRTSAPSGCWGRSTR